MFFLTIVNAKELDHSLCLQTTTQNSPFLPSGGRYYRQSPILIVPAYAERGGRWPDWVVMNATKSHSPKVIINLNFSLTS